MNLAGNPLAVQISNGSAHPVLPAHSGAWGIAIMFVGLVLVGKGTLPTVRFYRWHAQAKLAIGRVVENVPRSSWPWRTEWTPIIEFDTGDTTVRSHLPAPASRRALPLGCAVDVLFDPRDPRRATMADAHVPVSAYLIIGLTIVGVFLALVA